MDTIYNDMPELIEFQEDDEQEFINAQEDGESFIQMIAYNSQIMHDIQSLYPNVNILMECEIVDCGDGWEELVQKPQEDLFKVDKLLPQQPEPTQPQSVITITPRVRL